MCTLMKTSEMPDKNNGKNEGKKKFISLFMKPNNEGENYRFRLLWYKQSSKNDRKTPYFSQMIHDHWGETEKGQKIVDDVIICPGTKYAHYDEEKFLVNEKTGKKYLNCPICMKANENLVIAKNSGWKDKVASKKYFALKSKFRGIVPVYVVHDPNTKKIDENGNEKFINDGQLKVLIFTNKEEFEKFDEIVQEERSKAYLASKEGKGYEIFNGENGVDFYVHMENKEEVKNQGKPNEYTSTVRKITAMKFGSKVYDIPTITEDAINSFEMDDQYYISNTKDELEDFYTKYYGHEEVQVPDEDVDMSDVDMTVKKTENVEKKIETSNTFVKNDISISDDEIDDLTTDPDDLPPTNEHVEEKKEESAPMSKDELNEILDDIDI